MNCTRENPAGCPVIAGSLAKTKHALKKMSEAAADACEDFHKKGFSTAGVTVIHPGCWRVIAAKKGK